MKPTLFRQAKFAPHFSLLASMILQYRTVGFIVTFAHPTQGKVDLSLASTVVERAVRPSTDSSTSSAYQRARWPLYDGKTDLAIGSKETAKHSDPVQGHFAHGRLTAIRLFQIPSPPNGNGDTESGGRSTTT
ncbi:unnamed protein product [Peniophora sp. CBMAI 1063]|nr:unnamed protein product [Peniophora sp. CBMAI 1063]